MTKQELLDKIKTAEKSLESGLDEQYKVAIRSKLQKYREQLAEMEKEEAPVVEAGKEAASTTKKEQASMSVEETRKKISALKQAIASPAVKDEQKEKMRKVLAELEESLGEKQEEKKAPAPVVEVAKEAASMTKKEKDDMSIEETRKKISALKQAIASPAVKDEQKQKMRKLLGELQDSIGEKREEEVIERKVEKLREKAESEVKKLEEKVKSPKTPAKAKEAAKKGLVQVKRQIKEAEKEAVREKTARKRGRPKKVAAPAMPSKTKAKVSAKPAVKKEKKPVTKRKTRAEVKYDKALTSLQRLVNKTKELRERYKGQGVDLGRDASRSAKPFGWRIAGSNRRPTRAEIKADKAYWEGRPNRADVKKNAYPKLADGGMMADGGRVFVGFALV